LFEEGWQAKPAINEDSRIIKAVFQGSIEEFGEYIKFFFSRFFRIRALVFYTSKEASETFIGQNLLSW